LEAGPDGMTVDPSTGLLTWIAGEPGEYRVVLAVTNARGSDRQEFTLTVAEGELVRETFEIAEGWLQPPGDLLSALGLLDDIAASDDLRLEIPAKSWGAFDFSGEMPETARIELVTVVVEYHESASMPGDAVVWEIGHGTLDAPIAEASTYAEPVRGAPNEKAVSWEVGEWLTTPQAYLSALFVIRNTAVEGSVYVDRIHVEVTYVLP
ncbi:MAG: hypothetical protein DCC58_18100, partial [Chloroflexi bacterium]